MSTTGRQTIFYKRSNFATRLPVGRLYSPSHVWLERQAEGVWRVGLTKFATRMLGETVDCGFEPEPGTPVEPGAIIGWIEGFKALSDIYCVLRGEFVGPNPVLKEKIDLVHKDCQGDGWLYAVKGEPDARCMGAEAYRDHLDRAIVRILEKRKEPAD